jgi:hypothetical protein
MLGAFIVVAKPSRNLKDLLLGTSYIFLLPLIVTGVIEWLNSDFTTMSSYKQIVLDQVGATSAVAVVSTVVLVLISYRQIKREYDSTLSDNLDLVTYIYHGHMKIKSLVTEGVERNNQQENFDSSGYMNFGQDNVDKYRNETLQKDLDSSSSLIESLLDKNKKISEEIKQMYGELHRLAQEEASKIFSDLMSLREKLMDIGSLNIEEYSSIGMTGKRLTEEDFTRAKVTMLLTTFMEFYFGDDSQNYRFTIRKLNVAERKMDSTIALCDQYNNEAGSIPLDSRNLISRSLEADRPMIFSENTEYHFDTGNEGFNSGRYDDYLTYTFASYELDCELLPLLSLCIDVKGSENVKLLKEIKNNGILEVLIDELSDFIDRSALDIFYSFDQGICRDSNCVGE